MINRDPLQAVQSPYELLGVDQEADAEAVRSAFPRAIAAGKASGQRLLEARTVLLRPVDRALADAFLYSPAALAGLSPGWDGDGAALALPARFATAEAWTRALRASFPELGTIHSLAVLWYWWAAYESERFATIAEALQKAGAAAGTKTAKRTLLSAVAQAEGRDCGSGPDGTCTDPDCPWYGDWSYTCPSIADLWRKAIAYWAALIASRAFWTARLGVNAADAKTACETVENRLRDHVASLEGRLSRASATGSWTTWPSV